MKKIGKLTIILIVVFIVLINVFSVPKKENITKILESDSYSYLSKEAKEYVEKVYEETGEIVLTEKNKEENKPYLNPKYLAYISLSEEEQEQIGDIPEIYTVDFSIDKATEEYPSTFDLRNVNGKNYVTPLKHQQSLNLCWAFTSIEQAESYLLVQEDKSYTSTSTIFSPRQMDYATSTDGIQSYTNDYGSRTLSDGGNFLGSTFIMANALSLVPEATFPFNLSSGKRESYDVLNYNNSLYELNSSVILPTITSATKQEDRENYMDFVKEHVIKYGGAYVGTEGPGYSCSSINSDNNTIIRVDESCERDGGHAMQVIGWDDNYSYSYCQEGKKHTSPNGCASENLRSGKGAWLLRNSWGSSYSYVYLSYDSLDIDFSIITSLEKMSDRKWDNNYHSTFTTDYIYFTYNDNETFTKKIDTPEKIEKVKFMVYGKGGTYNLSISSGKEAYSNIKQVTIPYPGYFTIDLSDQNILITDSSFRVTLTSTNSVYINTKNIPSSRKIVYTLYDSNKNISSYFSVNHNTVSRNDINPLITIKKGIPEGIYSLKMSYNGVEEEMEVLIGDFSPVTISYYKNDETSEVKTSQAIRNKAYTLEENTYEREGYVFKEWNTSANGKGTSYSNKETISQVKGSMSLYAIWTPITYTIEFQANGGEGSMTNQTILYDESISLKKNTYEREGYQFSTWNTKSDGSGTSYKNQEEIKNLTTKDQEKIILYAIWQEENIVQSEKYQIDDKNNYINSIKENTSIEEFQKNLEVKEGYTIEINTKEKNILYTGSTTKILKGNQVIVEFTNVVLGDVNGDGVVNSGDLFRLRQYLLNMVNLQNAYWIAADANSDQNVNSGDLFRIRQHLLGIRQL